VLHYKGASINFVHQLGYFYMKFEKILNLVTSNQCGRFFFQIVWAYMNMPYMKKGQTSEDIITKFQLQLLILRNQMKKS
jgi:hypothetical protein